jgi:hypothetical protein
MIEDRLRLLLDRFLQVGDTVGRRYTDAKDISKGLVLVIDDEAPNDTGSSHCDGGM